MAASTVLVLPTFSEGLGRVIIEAMAVGRPVIASDVGGVPDLVVDGQTGFLVPPGDPSRLADRLRWIFMHPAEAKRMGALGHHRIRTLFSTTKYVSGYREVFETAVRTARSNDKIAHTRTQLGH
jgi:glycosyltransferase involved in cell wall biosynthesis